MLVDAPLAKALTNIHLTAKKQRGTIEPNNVTQECNKATTMIFIRRHMLDTLQTKYLTEEDPRAL